MIVVKNGEVDSAMTQFTSAENESQKSVAALSGLEGFEDPGEISPLKSLNNPKMMNLMRVTNIFLLNIYVYLTVVFVILMFHFFTG